MLSGPFRSVRRTGGEAWALPTLSYVRGPLRGKGGWPMGTSERIAALVEPILLDRGHELYDVELTGATVRVLVDRDGGVALDDLETISRDISTVLDEADPMPDRFFLEVSSPGLERPF